MQHCSYLGCPLVVYVVALRTAALIAPKHTVLHF